MRQWWQGGGDGAPPAIALRSMVLSVAVILEIHPPCALNDACGATSTTTRAKLSLCQVHAKAYDVLADEALPATFA